MQLPAHVILLSNHKVALPHMHGLDVLDSDITRDPGTTLTLRHLLTTRCNTVRTPRPGKGLIARSSIGYKPRYKVTG